MPQKFNLLPERKVITFLDEEQRQIVIPQCWHSGIQTLRRICMI